MRPARTDTFDYTITGLLTKRADLFNEAERIRGTEGAMGNPAPTGARVVVLDTALASLPIAEADLGIPWNWRIGPASRPVSDETYVAQTFTPAGVGLRPFSVAHVEQPWRNPRAPGDLTIRWTRRSRALAADSWGGLEVPLAEELEAYEGWKSSTARS
ncbi:hypothetical protein [Nitratireductor sp. CH_MIT9313-5]|uniref:hypothetical protein n=1 Tax=Nitratireductor sp. CH_MIT9313-5 TaxID=3107764 RepID=UPI003008C635